MEIITTHLEADFDGIASMVAAKKLYPEAHLVLPAGSQVRERAYLADFPIDFLPPASIDLRTVTRMILVDCQEQGRLGKLEKIIENQHISIHIFDHHPGGDQNALLQSADLVRLEAVGATITLLCEQLEAQSFSWTPQEATLFAIALYEETGQFSYPHTTPRDFHVGARLVQTGADVNQVSRYLQRKWTTPQLELFNALLQASRIRTLSQRRILFTTLTWKKYIQDLAPVVQQLGQLHGTDAVVIAVAMEGKVQVIGRSRYPDMDMNALLRPLGGGGHTMAAAASVKDFTLVEVAQRLQEGLEQQGRTWLPIRTLMTAPVRTVQQGTIIKHTERLMTQYEVNALPVVDAKGQFMGLATREAVQKALYHKLGSRPIDQIMQQDIFLASPSTPFEDVEHQMVERNQRIVPILDQDTIVGIFSRTDLLRALHQDRPAPDASAPMPSAPENPSEPPLRTRHLKKLMENQLSPSLLTLLDRVGALANRLGVGAFLVGGFVRDLLLGNKNTDVDIVVEGDGVHFGQTLAKDIQADWRIHERFGTVSLTLPKPFASPQLHHLDIATARTEYYEYPTALPTVERSSIKKDLYRRDFTINALAIRLNHPPGELLDYFGGQRDIKDGVVRVLHSLSFVEDPTRVFRAIRFEQRFGFSISKETQHFINQAESLELFQRLSGSRLGNELIHLLEEPAPAKGVQRLRQLKLLRFIHPKLQWKDSQLRLFESIAKILDWYEVECEKSDIHTWLCYALTWFEPLGPPELLDSWKRLGFPQKMIKTTHTFLSSQAGLRRTLNKKQLASSEIHGLLAPWPKEFLLVLMAKAQTKSSSHIAMGRIREFLTTWQHMTITLTGHDLESLELPKGPSYKRILNQLFAAKLDGLVTTPEDEYRLAKTLVAQERTQGKKTKSPATPSKSRKP